MNHINYTIISELKLIIEHYTGSITMEDIIRLKKDISKQNKYSPKHDVIMDLRYATLNFEVADLNNYVNFANSYEQIIGKRKTGFITSKPKQVALTTIFSYVKGSLPIDSRTFSTLNALIVWLNHPMHAYNIIEGKLQELQQTL